MMTAARTGTKLKQMEEELADCRNILRNLFDSSLCMMGVIELAGGRVLVTDCNNTAASFFALEHGALPQPLLAGEAEEHWFSQCNNCCTEGLPISFDYDHSSAKGRSSISVVIAPIGSGPSDRPRFTFVAENFASRNRLRDEIQRSQARLTDILESIRDGFLAIDYQWRITYANQRAALNSDYERDELLGRNLWEVFPELVRTPLETEYRKAMTQRLFRLTEILWGAPECWYEVRINPTPEGISVYWADISHRKTAEKHLLQINEQLENRVAERTQELAVIVHSLQAEVAERKSTEQRLLQLNGLYAVLSETNQAIVHTSHRDSLFQEICRVAVEHGGFSLAWIGLLDEQGIVHPQAWSGREEGFLDLIHVYSQDRVFELPATSAAIRSGVLWITNRIAREGQQQWQAEAEKLGFESVAAIPLKLNDKVIGAFTLYASEPDYFSKQQIHLLQQMSVDIAFALDNLDLASRRREAELKLAQESDERLKTMEKLHQRERMLLEQNRHAAMGEMIGNIAHQWRQPLNSLALLMQRLPLFHEAGKLDHDFLEDNVTRAMDLIQHMSQTIDDFRNFFRPEKCRTDFRLTEIVGKTMSLLEGSFKSHGIAMEIRTEGDPLVNGYANEYSQILLNILVNAKDAFLQCAHIPEPRVIITLATDGDKAVVTIADNAGGIPDEVMPKIFDPYFTTKGPDKGTGIGLHMAKTIIENSMKGRLTVCNNGDGAEFRIEV